MKISSAVIFLLLVSAIFATYGLIVHESNQTYSSTIPNYVPLDGSNWSNGATTGEAGGGKFDFVDSINGTVGPLVDKFKLIKDPDQGFFSKIAAGLTAIPYAILLVPDVLWNTLLMAGTIVTAFFTVLNIPAWFIIMACVGFLVWGIFKLLEYYQRVPI